MAHWCFATASSILKLNTDLAWLHWRYGGQRNLIGWLINQSHSLRSNRRSLCWSLCSRPMHVHGHSTLVPLPFGITSRSPPVEPLQLIPSTDVSKHISLTLAFPYKHQNAQWLVYVMELLHRFCCWTLMQRSCHWVWLCLAYWHHGNMIDWAKLILDFEFMFSYGGQNPDTKRYTWHRWNQNSANYVIG